MKSFTSTLVFALTMGLLASSCGKPKKAPNVSQDEDPGYFETEPVSVIGTNKNQLADESTEFLRSRAGDAIHWQQWSPDLFANAELEQRPVFAVVVDGSYTTCTKFLDAFTDPQNRFADQFNDSYLCTLVDTNAHPEMGLTSHLLSTEIKLPFSYPVIIWYSHQGNPVGWLPLFEKDLGNLSEVVSQSNLLVAKTWEDSPTYFVNNSRADNERRKERTRPAPVETAPSAEEVKALLTASIGKLTALYDPATRTIDRSGSLVPGALLRFIALSLTYPDSPEYVRTRALTMLTEASSDLASSGMTDPLDGGIFASRRTRDWTLPHFIKATRTQSEIAMTYAHAYKITGQEEFSKQAEDTLAFVRRHFGSGESGTGAFQTVRKDSFEDELYFWSTSDLEELLTPDQLAVIMEAYGVKEEGNIPAFQDLDRRYFHRNILSPAKNATEVASVLQRDPLEVSSLIKAAAETLRAHRAVKAKELEALITESTRITEYNATHAHALLQCGLLLDKSELIVEGQALLTFLEQKHYNQKDGLWRIPPVNTHRGVKARGRDYASLIEALLLAYRIELRAEDLAWAEALAREALLVLSDEDGFILESPQQDLHGALPIPSLHMILGRSTWGSLLGPLERLARISSKQQFGDAAEMIKLRLLYSCERAPIAHIDLLESLMVEVSNCVAVLHGDPAAPELQNLHATLLEHQYHSLVVVHAKALDSGQHQQFDVPKTGYGVTLFREGRNLGTTTSAQALKTLLNDSLEPK